MSPDQFNHGTSNDHLSVILLINCLYIHKFDIMGLHLYTFFKKLDATVFYLFIYLIYTSVNK